MRGQGYDNGANMSGKFKGVQAHILQKNCRAFFCPCCSHTFNLVIVDAVKCNSSIVNFFDLIEAVYTFLSASTKRWGIFKSKCPKFTVKNLSTTRWESHINAVRTI